MNISINPVKKQGRILQSWLSFEWGSPKNIVQFRFEEFTPEEIAEQASELLGSASVDMNAVIELLNPYLQKTMEAAIEYLNKTEVGAAPSFEFNAKFIAIKKAGKKVY